MLQKLKHSLKKVVSKTIEHKVNWIISRKYMKEMLYSFVGSRLFTLGHIDIGNVHIFINCIFIYKVET